jgi:hypothetical protein
MAPEQVECPSAVGPQADIFALGIMIYEMLSGKVPYAWPESAELDYAGVFALTRAKGSLPVPVTTFRQDLSLACDTLIARCLVHDLEYRYPNVRQLAQDIAELDAEGPALFRSLWPGYVAQPDDFTVRNPDLFRAPHTGSATGPNEGAAGLPTPVAAPFEAARAASAGPVASLGGSVAVGEVDKPSFVARPGAKLGAIGLGVAVVATAGVLGLTRAVQGPAVSPARVPASSGYQASRPATNAQATIDAGIVEPASRVLVAPAPGPRGTALEPAAPSPSPAEPKADESSDASTDRKRRSGGGRDWRRRPAAETTGRTGEAKPAAPRKPLSPDGVPGL